MVDLFLQSLPALSTWQVVSDFTQEILEGAHELAALPKDNVLVSLLAVHSENKFTLSEAEKEFTFGVNWGVLGRSKNQWKD